MHSSSSGRTGARHGTAAVARRGAMRELFGGSFGGRNRCENHQDPAPKTMSWKSYMMLHASDRPERLTLFMPATLPVPWMLSVSEASATRCSKGEMDHRCKPGAEPWPLVQPGGLPSLPRPKTWLTRVKMSKILRKTNGCWSFTNMWKKHIRKMCRPSGLPRSTC